MKRLVLKSKNIEHINIKALKNFILNTDHSEDSKKSDGEKETSKEEETKYDFSDINISLQYKSSYFILIDTNENNIYKLYDLLDERIFDDDIVIECFLIDEKVDCGQKVKNRLQFEQKLKENDNFQETDNQESIDKQESTDNNFEEESINSDCEKKEKLTNKQLKKRERKKERKQKKIDEINERITKRDNGFLFNPDDERFSAIETDKRYKIEPKK